MPAETITYEYPGNILEAAEMTPILRLLSVCQVSTNRHRRAQLENGTRSEKSPVHAKRPIGGLFNSNV